MTDNERPSTPIRQDGMTRDERIEEQSYRGLPRNPKEKMRASRDNHRRNATSALSPRNILLLDFN